MTILDKTRLGGMAILSVVLGAAAAHAVPVSTNADMFGQLTTLDGTDEPEFGGDGIPSDAVNISTFQDSNGNTLRLGLTATPRAINGEAPPTPTNNGVGTFFALPGLSVQDRAFWNFSFYAEIAGSLSIQDIGLQLLYDLDPEANTDIADLGVINAALFDSSNTVVAQGSQNLTFGYLSNDNPGFNTAPAVTAFDPDSGEYSFLLRADNFGSVGINVNVGDVAPVPLPAGLPLLLAGLGAFGYVRSRRKA